MNLEEYIRKLRKKMDVEKPDEESIWAGISSEMSRKSHIKRMLFWKIAAAVLLAIALGVTLNNNFSGSDIQKPLMSGLSPEMARQEKQLLEKIDTYQERLQQTNYKKTQLVTQHSELKRIDRLITQYSKDLDTYGPRPEILNTLIDLYHKKIKVMDRMLNEIQKSKSHEDKKIHT